MPADALVRHMFALSMELHRILGHIIPPTGMTGGSHPVGNGNAPGNEELRQILCQALAKLDQMVHQIQALVFAHLAETTPPESATGPGRGG